jgi:hypothetical protein
MKELGLLKLTYEKPHVGLHIKLNELTVILIYLSLSSPVYRAIELPTACTLRA